MIHGVFRYFISAVKKRGLSPIICPGKHHQPGVPAFIPACRASQSPITHGHDPSRGMRDPGEDEFGRCQWGNSNSGDCLEPVVDRNTISVFHKLLINGYMHLCHAKDLIFIEYFSVVTQA